jgi:uncharacterized membrane protein HdeD (DUF308 family)
MLDALTRKWWVLVVRGLCGVLVGALAFTMPGLAILSAVLAWGLFAEVDGITALIVALSGRHQVDPPRSPLFVVGVLGILAGLITWIWPALSVRLLLWIVAGWAIGRGLFQILAGLELRKVVEGEWFMILSGALSVVFGVAVLYRPLAGVVTLAYLIGLYACAVGILEIGLGLRVRQFRQQARPIRGW